ncbi:unnamed protein product, partial [Polarella glacialis]
AMSEGPMATPRNGFTPRKVHLSLATTMLRDPCVRTPRMEPRMEATSDENLAQGRSMKAIWDLRKKQTQEWASCGDCYTVEVMTKPQAAQNKKSSYRLVQSHLTKHIRSIHTPRDNFVEPMSMAMNIGWHLGPDGVLPPNPTGPRTQFPKLSCAMTQHQDNMYATNSQNIIRRM